MDILKYLWENFVLMDEVLIMAEPCGQLDWDLKTNLLQQKLQGNLL